jgi:hypothetical protein
LGGATIFTVGLGSIEDLDHEALARIASAPEYYYQTTDGEALDSIYSEIAGGLYCRGLPVN